MPTHGLRLLLVTAYAHSFSHGLLQPSRQVLRHKALETSTASSSRTLTPSRPPSALTVFFANENDKNPPPKNNINLTQNATSGSNADLLQTLQLKDEAINQAQTAVSSLENALESAVSNLENMQQQLRRKVKDLEDELKTTRGELSATRGELDKVRLELAGAKTKLENSNDARGGLEWALGQSQEEARKAGERVEQLEGYLADLGVDASSVMEKKRTEVRCARVLVSFSVLQVSVCLLRHIIIMLYINRIIHGNCGEAVLRV